MAASGDETSLRNIESMRCGTNRTVGSAWRRPTREPFDGALASRFLVTMPVVRAFARMDRLTIGPQVANLAHWVCYLRWANHSMAASGDETSLRNIESSRSLVTIVCSGRS
jgi:hypothetical protein